MNISVIIPVFNAELYIKRAVTSVLSQTEVTEIILIEDGSTDRSLQLCLQLASMDNRVLVLQHTGSKNKGVAASRNLGIKNAKEPYIAFLDADDYYLPDRFKQTKQCFANDESVDGVYEMIGILNSSGEIKNYSGIQSVSAVELFENLQPIGSKVWFHVNGLTVKCSIFEASGFFDESLKTSEDTFQWFKMAATSKLVAGKITQPVALSEKHLGGLSSSREQVQKDFVLMLFKLFSWCKNRNCKNARKELVLNKLLFQSFNKPLSTTPKGINKIVFILKIILTDTGHVLLQSGVFRRFTVNLIGFNHVINFYNNHIKRLNNSSNFYE